MQLKRIKQNTLIVLIGFLLLSIKGTPVLAQRIIGYYPDYNYTAANAASIQYAKLTHLYYFAINPTRTVTGQSAGALGYNDVWFTTASFNDVISKARTANPSIKIFIVTGGHPGSDADLSDRLEYIGNNATILNTFCNNIIAFITTNNLDGWDLDWEFPDSPSARTAHQNMLAAMRTKINALKLSNCKPYEISIAVGGGYSDVTSPRACWSPADNDNINAAALNYVDFMNIMAYDGDIGSPPCSFSSHEHYDLFVKAFTDWTTAFSISPSKINMGVGFYDNSGNPFNNIGNVNTHYNTTYWNGGSGCPNIQSKISYAKAQGTAGIFIWELTLDNLCAGTTPTCYSLLDCIYQYTHSTWGTWSAPGNPCTLPVSLIAFNGINNGSSNILNWSTASEKNNDYFEVEKSMDGKIFTSIARIKGNNNSNQTLYYHYTDELTGSTIVYYRLNQYDTDGTSTWSEIISINNTLRLPTCTVSPNPFEESFTVTGLLLDQQETSVRMILTDITGRVMEDDLQFIEQGKLQAGSALPAGLYTCTLITKKNTYSLRILKLKQ